MSDVLHLRYGKGVIECPAPPGPYDVIEAAVPQSSADPVRLLDSALDHPINSPAFETLFSPGDSVGIIVPDVTRYSGVEHILPELLNRLGDCGIKESAIEIIFALGIHRQQSREERTHVVGPEAAARLPLIDHSSDQSSSRYLGTTSRGTPVEISIKALAKAKLLLIGTITFHYFAGFGGGRKMIVPGIASARTCAANHLLVLADRGRHPGIGPGKLNQNPVHLDMLEGCELVHPALLITTILNPQREMIQIFSGHYRDSHIRACHYYANLFTARVDQAYDVVIVSAGGHPSDINFIQAHKAIDMAYHVARPGGTIVAVAECAEGFGHPKFFPWFAHRDLETLEHHLRASYHIYGQTAHATLWKAGKVDILLLSTLKADDVRTMRMHPITSLSDALDFIRDKYRRHMPSICILPHGATVLPVVEA